MKTKETTYYILKEIIEKYEGDDQINILEISQDEKFLLDLKDLYEREFKLINEKISKAIQIDRILTVKIIKELPDPEIIEQENLNGITPTYEQQKIRSKIGMENANKIRKNLELRNKLRNEELSKLSDYDKECFKHLDLHFNPTEYIVEKFESAKPCYLEI